MRTRPGFGRENVFDGTWFGVVRCIGQNRLQGVDDAEKRELTVDERGHQFLVCRVVDGRSATSSLAGRLGQPYPWKGLVVERQELPILPLRPVHRRRRGVHAIWPAKRQRN